MPRKTRARGCDARWWVDEALPPPLPLVLCAAVAIAAVAATDQAPPAQPSPAPRRSPPPLHVQTSNSDVKSRSCVTSSRCGDDGLQPRRRHRRCYLAPAHRRATAACCRHHRARCRRHRLRHCLVGVVPVVARAQCALGRGVRGTPHAISRDAFNRDPYSALGVIVVVVVRSSCRAHVRCG